MIPKLTIENYRGFKEFNVTGIKPVNLIVGRNNGGKTSLLEALHIAFSRGDYSVIQSISQRRGEYLNVSSGDLQHQNHYRATDISCFYYGHKVDQCSSFAIEAHGLGRTEIYVRAVESEDAHHGQAHFLEMDSNAGFSDFPGKFALESTWNGQLTATTIVNGGSVSRRGKPKPAVPSCQFLSADSLSGIELRNMWDRVIAQGVESRTYEALRIIQPDIVDIQFLSGQRLHSQGGSASGVVVRLEGKKTRVPLGSFGDGMRRLLSLAVLLSGVEEYGAVLIDEIDTGIHYSVMADLWSLVNQTAIERNIQVFATTHSLDCLRGIATYCEAHPNGSENVGIHKIDCRIPNNVMVDNRLIHELQGTFDPR